MEKADREACFLKRTYIREKPTVKHYIGIAVALQRHFVRENIIERYVQRTAQVMYFSRYVMRVEGCKNNLNGLLICIPACNSSLALRIAKAFVGEWE